MIKKTDKIFVAGHKGLVGSAIVRKLKSKGFKKIILADRRKLDLINQNKVFSFSPTRLSKLRLIWRLMFFENIIRYIYNFFVLFT